MRYMDEKSIALDVTTLERAAVLAEAKGRLPDAFVLIIKEGETPKFVPLDDHNMWDDFARAQMDKGADQMFLYCVHSAVIKQKNAEP